MADEKLPFSALADFVPEGSANAVLFYIHKYKIRFTITRHRQTILGDYRHATHTQPHRITVNGNLNKYSFLITFLHELAHLNTFEKYHNRVQPHGAEWKAEYGKILVEFIGKNVFPNDVETALLKTLHNPGASSCSDDKLLRVLKKYDAKKEGIVFVEQLKDGELFMIKGKRVFRRGAKQVKRYKCLEIATGKWYLFNGIYEVKKVDLVT